MIITSCDSWKKVRSSNVREADDINGIILAENGCSGHTCRNSTLKDGVSDTRGNAIGRRSLFASSMRPIYLCVLCHVPRNFHFTRELRGEYNLH